MAGEDCLLHFSRWVIHLGDVMIDVLRTLPDIAQKEGSGGPQPVSSQSHCEGGQYLASYVSLRCSLMLHSERAVSCQCFPN